MLRNTIDEFTNERDVIYQRRVLPAHRHVGERILQMWHIPVERVEQKLIPNGRVTRTAVVTATEGEWTWGPRDLENFSVKRQWNDIYKREEYMIVRVMFVDGKAERAKWKAFDRKYGITDWRTQT